VCALEFYTIKAKTSILFLLLWHYTLKKLLQHFSDWDPLS